MNLVLIGLGGAIGAITRYGISQLTDTWYKGSFPLATLLANVLATFLFALVYFIFYSYTNFNTQLKQLLIIGFCGGLSTFSTFSFETFELIKREMWFTATLNVVLSLIMCLAVIYLISKKVNL